MQRTITCLWFDDQAEEAATFYVSLLPNSRITNVSYYQEGMPKSAGTVLTVAFTLDGTEYLALNGGPHFTFSPAVSIVVYGENQAEVDALWTKLTAEGQESQCGWLTDKYGLSWQIVPRAMLALLNSKDRAASRRVMSALLTMKKLDLSVLQAAHDGK